MTRPNDITDLEELIGISLTTMRNDHTDDPPPEITAVTGLHPDGYCAECARYERDGDTFYPPHTASRGCQSGKRPHCTCDACW